MSTVKSSDPSGNRGVARSAGVIAAATLCSRILGFIRDIVIARLFGIYIYAQAFVVAFKIPNLFRDLVGEGATNAAFVPVFSEYRLKHSRQEFWELANVVLNLMLVVLAVLVLAGVAAAPLLVRVMAPGFIAEPEKLAVTIRLTRIIFPYVLLACLAAYTMGILNSLKHFAVPAFAPCLLNISVIIFALAFGEGITGLACGILVGGFLQLVVQIPVLFQKGFRLRLFERFRHPAAKIIGKLMLPRVASSCIYQLNNLVDTIFGSLSWIVGEGGVAVLYYSYRLVLFPLGIFSNSLSQAILPAFSEHAIQEDGDRLKKSLSWSLRATFLVILPASAGLMVLAGPIVGTLFGGGKFDAYSVRTTSGALFFYSIGLFAYAAKKILQSCFFALKDTATPAKIAAIALVLNVILNAAFMFPFKISGVALATSVSGIISFVILFLILERRLKGIDVRGICVSFLRILAASICMALICYLISAKLGPAVARPAMAVNLSLAIAAGVASYVVFCFIFRVREMSELLYWLIKRKAPNIER